jgi:hypothetical protein
MRECFHPYCCKTLYERFFLLSQLPREGGDWGFTCCLPYKIVEIQQDSWVIQMEKDDVLLLVESNKGTLSHEIINECRKVCYFVKHF